MKLTSNDEFFRNLQKAIFASYVDERREELKTRTGFDLAFLKPLPLRGFVLPQVRLVSSAQIRKEDMPKEKYDGREEWSRFYGKPVTEDEYRQICQDLRGFFEVLREWDKESKASASTGQF